MIIEKKGQDNGYPYYIIKPFPFPLIPNQVFVEEAAVDKVRH